MGCKEGELYQEICSQAYTATDKGHPDGDKACLMRVVISPEGKLIVESIKYEDVYDN